MIVVKTANFLYSRTEREHTQKKEVCFCGRSNAGKSSLINMLCGQKKLARTSSEPGRTRLINYFELVLREDATGEERPLLLVDLPGYGYARVEKSKKNEWDKMIEGYFEGDNIGLCVSIVDSRLPPQPNDKALIGYLYTLGLPILVAASKIDKISKPKRAAALQTVATDLKLGKDNIVLCSGIDGTGKQALLQKMYDIAIEDLEIKTEHEVP
ncbi:MAG: ribosome biogenesis GTP-binding protein YihA/YsxC [Firmicutes bacterium]|nr:ribosome biogenesis GTP-binding protein YihA/YsxC [Bacillota bacterium]